MPTLAAGTVVSVKLTNFMTYTQVSLEAGEYLNLVLGPNGTGKSALVCGIIVGLAGEATTTGRSGNLGEYIRFGCNEALIEIELHNPDGQNYIVSRKILSLGESSSSNNFVQGRKTKSECKSHWLLNGKSANLSEVKRFITGLNIRVDNLCQFLPQERVVEFARMNSRDLLKNTEKAAGESGMFDNHERLCALTKEIKELETRKGNLEYQATVETNVNERKKDDIEKIRERKKLEKKKKLLELKMPFIEYNKNSDDYEKLRDTCKEKEREVCKSKNSLKPFELKLKEVSIACDKLNTQIDQLNKQLVATTKTLKDSVRQSQTIEDNSAIQKYKFELEREKERKLKIARLHDEIGNLKAKLDDYVDSNSNIDELIQTSTRDLEEVREKIDQITDSLGNLEHEIEKQRGIKFDAERQINIVKNISKKKLDNLRVANRDASRMTEWLQNNASLFKKTVHPPIMISINVEKVELAKYVEMAIAQRDLFLFVCEDRNDLHLLRNKAIELKCKVPMAHIKPEDIHAYVATEDISRLNKYGFHCYLTTIFSAPAAVKAYLCLQFNLHQVPLGNEETERHIDSIKANTNLIRFFSRQSSYTIRTSKYDGNKTIAENQIRDARYLNVTIDAQLLKEKEAILNECQQTINRLGEKLVKEKVMEQSYRQEMRDLSKKLGDMEARVKYKKSLQNEITNKEKRVKVEENTKIDLESAKNSLMNKTSQLLLSKKGNLKHFIDTAKTISDVNLKRSLYIAKLSALDHIYTRLTENRDRANEKSRQLYTELEKLKRSVQDRKKSLDTLWRKTKSLFHEHGFDITDDRCLPTNAVELFSELPDDLDEMDDILNRCIARIDLIGGGGDYEGLEDDFNNRVNLIKKKNHEMQTIEKDLDGCLKELGKIKHEWLPPLRSLVERINSNFSRLMTKLNYGGEVKLYEDDSVSKVLYFFRCHAVNLNICRNMISTA